MAVSPGRRFGRALARAPFYLLVAAIFVYCLFPFYWVLRSSFMPEVTLFQTPVEYFPSHPTLSNYREVLSASFFTDALLNSAIVAGSVTLLSLAIGSSAAFALGRLRFHGRSFVLYLMLSMTIFPQIVILGALYTTISKLHLYDALGSLIFSYLIFTLPFTIWVLTSFVRAVPADLEEAAYVDGATSLQVFWKVLLPLIAPVSSRQGYSRSSRPGTSTSTRCRSSSRRATTRCRSRSPPSWRRAPNPTPCCGARSWPRP